jgi:hypothetical protein
VIAIAPKIGTVEISPAPSSAQASAATNGATQSFSDMLAGATPFAGRSAGDQSIGTGEAEQKSFLSVAGGFKREPQSSDSKSSDSKTSDSKSSDSRTNDAQVRDKVSTQSSAPSQDAQSNVVSPAMAPPPTPALPWTVGINDFTTNDFTTNDLTPDTLLSDPTPKGTALNRQSPDEEGTGSRTLETASVASPNSTGMLASLQTASKDVAHAEPQADSPDSENSSCANLGETKSTVSLTPNFPDVATPVLKPQSGNVAGSSQTRNVSGGATGTTDAANKARAAKTEIDQALLAPTSSLPASLPAVPDLQGVEQSVGLVNSSATRPQGSALLTSKGTETTQKDSEVKGTAKAETRKDDSQSSSSSLASSQALDSVPAKAADASPIFSLDGIQTSSLASDGKGAVAGTAHQGSPQEPGQTNQKSATASQTPLPGDPSVAYPTSMVQSAKLVERIGEAELRLGIRSGEFGSVDIRTSMIRNQFTAEISVERGELGRVMAAELPGLQSRLAEQRVPVTSITLQNHAGDPSTASEQQKPRDGHQLYAASSGSGREESGRQEGPISAALAVKKSSAASRLDIHM